jgi:hypothetical protein
MPIPRIIVSDEIRFAISWHRSIEYSLRQVRECQVSHLSGIMILEANATFPDIQVVSESVTFVSNRLF